MYICYKKKKGWENPILHITCFWSRNLEKTRRTELWEGWENPTAWHNMVTCQSLPMLSATLCCALEHTVAYAQWNDKSGTFQALRKAQWNSSTFIQNQGPHTKHASDCGHSTIMTGLQEFYKCYSHKWDNLWWNLYLYRDRSKSCGFTGKCWNVISWNRKSVKFSNTVHMTSSTNAALVT